MHIRGQQAFGGVDGAVALQVWKDCVARLGKSPNVHMKLGGITMVPNGFGLQERPTPIGSEELAELLMPYFSHCLDCFGALGWPRVGCVRGGASRASYSIMLSLPSVIISITLDHVCKGQGAGVTPEDRCMCVCVCAYEFPSRIRELRSSELGQHIEGIAGLQRQGRRRGLTSCRIAQRRFGRQLPLEFRVIDAELVVALRGALEQTGVAVSRLGAGCRIGRHAAVRGERLREASTVGG